MEKKQNKTKTQKPYNKEDPGPNDSNSELIPPSSWRTNATTS